MKSISATSLHDNVYPFLYLFTMDLTRICHQNYSEYEKNEPGFSIPFFQAYVAAFNEEMDGRMTHQLVKKIHKIAMGHMPNVGRGQYRSDSGNFLIGFEEYGHIRNPAYSVTLDGFNEFISYWMMRPALPVHMLSFENKADPTTNSFALVSDHGALVWKTVINRAIKQEPFDSIKHMPIIHALSKNFGYEFYINAMSFGCDVVVNIQEKTEQLMQQIFDEFHAEIARAELADEKITVIAKHIQRIEQLHPFRDGNIRTCYILLNKLLSDYGLPLSIMLNPNRLDACSLAEVVKTVKDGQAIYQQLVNNPVPIAFLVETDEKIAQIRQIICMPHHLNQPELLDSFCKAIIKRENGALISRPILEAPQRFFVPHEGALLVEAIKPYLGSGKCESILAQLNKGNYACALRNACNLRELSIIKEILTFKNALDIDVNRQSTNGNTALDWLDLGNATVEPEQLAEVRNLLVEHGAVNNKTQRCNKL